jgi:hypothetical protein
MMHTRLRGFSALDRPTIYSIVGEHRNEPAWLLLLGSDGHHYFMSLLDEHGEIEPIDPGSEWRIDRSAERRLREDLDTLNDEASPDIG